MFVQGVSHSIWLAVAVLALAAGAASAGTIYVSPSGNDDQDGSEARPLATPERALSAVAAGDTVLLRGGRYPLTHFLWMDKPGVTLASYPNEAAALVGSNRDVDGLPHVVCIVADRVALVDLEIVGGAYHGVKIDVEGTKATRGVRLSRCRIRDSGTDCVKTFNADGLLIDECDIGPSGVRDPSNAEGIDSIGSVGVTIRRCFVHDTATNGLYLKGGARDGLIESCRVERTGKFAGILLGQDTDEEFMRDGAKHEAIACVARNNLVITTGAAGMGTYSGDDVRFENNTLVDVAREGQAGFWVVTNGRGVPARRATFRKNIVVCPGERPAVFVKNLSGPLDADLNVYFATRGLCRFARESGDAAPETMSLDQWIRKVGADAHSRVGDPGLDEQYVPRAAAGVGARQGAPRPRATDAR